MKSFAVLALLFASAMSEAPVEKPTAVYFLAAQRLVEPKDVVKATEEVMAQLRARDGSDSGEYHVYLPDGRLQKVQYTTAPIKSEEVKEPAKPFFLVSQQPNQAFKVEPIYADSKSAAPKAQDYKEEQNVPSSNYVASIQYTDVKPISGPIYSYKPEPLVRIVRYAPRYQ